MKNISRKLLLSTLTVVLTVIALGTTTFAWFTITNTAKIQSFETQIAADEGIEVAIGVIDTGLLDAEQTKFEVNSPANLNWVTTLTAADIQEFIEFQYPNGFRFEHLTSADGKIFNTFAEDSVGSTIEEGFLELPLHFRSGDVYTINWTAVSLTGATPLPVWVSDVESFVDAAGTTRLRGDEVEVDPSDAIRISFHDTGLNTVTVYEKPFAGNNLVLGTGGDLTQSVDPDGDELTSNSYVPQNRGAHSYYFAKTNLYPAGISTVTTVATTTNLLTPGVDGTTVLTLVDDPLVDAGMTYYQEAAIYVWIEGWDSNAYNSILDEYVNISFTFKGVDIV